MTLIPFLLDCSSKSQKALRLISGSSTANHRSVVYNILPMSQELNNYKTSLCWHYTNKGYCSLF